MGVGREENNKKNNSNYIYERRLYFPKNFFLEDLVEKKVNNNIN
jgi:hypothetical protein